MNILSIINRYLMIRVGLWIGFTFVSLETKQEMNIYGNNSDETAPPPSLCTPLSFLSSLDAESERERALPVRS